MNKGLVMMKKISMLLPLLILVACENSLEVEKGASVIGLSASKICAGEVIAGVTGTASCSGGGGGGGGSGSGGTSVSVAEGLYVMSSRKDIASFDWLTGSDDLLNLISGVTDRTGGVFTLQALFDEADILASFKSKYQLMPNPITDSDGRCGTDEPGMCGTDGADGISKKHYLERITGRPDIECGTDAIVGVTASINDRVGDCASKNGAKAFYNGVQYGQDGEGDWKLVTRLSTGEEVWQDQRTKLLWSDKSASDYNWYQAAGYSKLTATSQAETYYDSAPNSGTDCNNSACQPAQPISVCAEVNGGELIDQSGIQTNYQANPENAFKGNLVASNGVIWKLPSRYDFSLAEVNGIRKVLPNMDYGFWSSSSVSYERFNAWYFSGGDGPLGDFNRTYVNSVRCVGLAPSVIP